LLQIIDLPKIIDNKDDNIKSKFCTDDTMLIVTHPKPGAYLGLGRLGSCLGR